MIDDCIMIAEGVRRNNGESYSPKASPRGNRSPLVNNRQDTTGTLKTTICLGKTPTIVHRGPFYLMKDLGCKFVFFWLFASYIGMNSRL